MILCWDTWPRSFSTSLSLQRFPQHIPIKCHSLEIPHGFLSRWCLWQREGTLACTKVMMPDDKPVHCIIHHQMLLARKLTAVSWAPQWSREEADFWQKLGSSVKKVTWWKDEHNTVRHFSVLSWLCHFGKSHPLSGPLWASWLNVFINEGHNLSSVIPKPGWAQESSEKLFTIQIPLGQ